MRVDPLLDHYPVRIREVTLGVILGIGSIFYIYPRFFDEVKKINKEIVQQILQFMLFTGQLRQDLTAFMQNVVHYKCFSNFFPIECIYYYMTM